MSVPVMPNIAALVRLLEECYGISSHCILHPLQRNDIAGRGVYRLDRTGGDSWVVRAYVHDSTRDWAAWLETRASLLHFLQQRAFPAPRIVHPTDGGIVASGGGWHVLVVTFIAGPTADDSAASHAVMAEQIAQLHTLSPVPGSGNHTASTSLPDSWWEPTRAIPYALHYLQITQRACATNNSLSALHAAFAAALERSRQLATLDTAVIHGDCWSGNAVRRGEDLVFIDWDSAGRGPAILDLASLLVTSQPDNRLFPQSYPDGAMVEAILRGYEKGRRLTATDLDALPDAIGFIAAWNGARQFFAGPLSEDGTEHLWLTKQRGRLVSAENLAALVRAVAS